jgi:hypothetical protein
MHSCIHTHTSMHIFHTFMHTYIHSCIHTCMHTHTHIHAQPGDGLWTCSVCGRDGPAVVLSCPNRCRACAATCALMGRDEYGAIPKHVCHDRSHIVKAFGSKGIPAEALYLPDFGKGRQVWEGECNLQWKDPSRTLTGVTNTVSLLDIIGSKEDPLTHCDVVPYDKVLPFTP